MSKFYPPVLIKKFRPLDIKFCKPDGAVFYQQPYNTEAISSTDDIIALGKRLYDAEEKAWQARGASEILETIADDFCLTMLDCAKHLKSLNDEKSKSFAAKINKLYLRMKSPLISCLTECFASIYVKDGMSAVERAIDKINNPSD